MYLESVPCSQVRSSVPPFQRLSAPPFSRSTAHPLNGVRFAFPAAERRDIRCASDVGGGLYNEQGNASTDFGGGRQPRQCRNHPAISRDPRLSRNRGIQR